jgi:DeoR/GlpR family transcriptional regulator of sugar metabolism
VDGKIRLSTFERHTRIRQMLGEQPEVMIAALAEMCGVSEMTIRRDLDKLERDGRVQRTHGGARASERMAFEFDFALRRQSHRREKQAIARRATQFVKPRQRFILDTGTTTLELAYLLKDYQEITVITPSLAVASVLQFSPAIETILLGGIIRQGSPDLTGVVTEKNLDMFAVNVAFQGADGIGLDGRLYNSDLRIASVDQKIRQCAKHTYILADSSKIGQTALATNGFIYEADALITDDHLDSRQQKIFEKMGATIIVVNPDE